VLLVVELEEVEVFAATVVAPVTTTIVVPEITVLLPSMSKASLTGMVFGPAIISLLLPSTMIVNCPPLVESVCKGRVTEVWEGKMRKGVPEMEVVEAPANPSGKADNGIGVAEGMIKRGVPFTKVVLAPIAEAKPSFCRAGTVVGFASAK
jgi:hypothetical protein